jgi:hypothetical protein
MGNGGQAMMLFFVYYRAADGEIIGWTNSHDPVAPDGYALAAFTEPFDPDPQTEKIDPATGEVVPKTAAERNAAVPWFRLRPIQ